MPIRRFHSAFAAVAFGLAATLSPASLPAGDESAEPPPAAADTPEAPEAPEAPASAETPATPAVAEAPAAVKVHTFRVQTLRGTVRCAFQRNGRVIVSMAWPDAPPILADVPDIVIRLRAFENQPVALSGRLMLAGGAYSLVELDKIAQREPRENEENLEIAGRLVHRAGSVDGPAWLRLLVPEKDGRSVREVDRGMPPESVVLLTRGRVAPAWRDHNGEYVVVRGRLAPAASRKRPVAQQVAEGEDEDDGEDEREPVIQVAPDAADALTPLPAPVEED